MNYTRRPCHVTLCSDIWLLALIMMWRKAAPGGRGAKCRKRWRGKDDMVLLEKKTQADVVADTFISQVGDKRC